MKKKNKNKKTKVASKVLALLANNSDQSSFDSTSGLDENLKKLVYTSKKYSRDTIRLLKSLQSVAPGYLEYLADATNKSIFDLYPDECLSINQIFFNVLTCSLDELDMNLDLLQVKFPGNRKIAQALATLDLLKKEADKKANFHDLPCLTLIDRKDFTNPDTIVAAVATVFFNYFHCLRFSYDISFPSLAYPYCCHNMGSDFDHTCEETIFKAIDFSMIFYSLGLDGIEARVPDFLDYQLAKSLYEELKATIQEVKTTVMP
jgi:hypothetical protein